MRYLLLPALLIACPAIAAGPAPAFSSQMAEALHKQYPQAKIRASQVVVGDFNKDGLPDFATFVGEEDNREEDLPIAVFLARPNGGYALHTESAAISGDPRATRGLEAKGQSLFLHRGGSDGCCADWAEHYQFQLRDGVFVLIGEESDQLPKGESDDEGRTSINYLTRQALFWRKLAGKRKERRLSFAMPALIKLKSFSDNGHYSAVPKVLQSHFDEQLRFVESK